MILPHTAYTTMGPRATETHGQLSLVWSAALSDDARAALRGKLLALPRKRRQRVNHARARARWEQRGAAVLARPDTHESTYALHVVRVYYTSQGGELLYFETTLPTNAAHALAYSCRLSQIWAIDTDAPRARTGARFVVLPSQSEASAVAVRRANVARARAWWRARPMAVVPMRRAA